MRKIIVAHHQTTSFADLIQPQQARTLAVLVYADGAAGVAVALNWFDLISGDERPWIAATLGSGETFAVQLGAGGLPLPDALILRVTVPSGATVSTTWTEGYDD